MAQEVERKFLLEELPPQYRECERVEIEQCYLSLVPEVRLRMVGLPSGEAEYYLTSKSDGLLSRLEVEEPISAVAFHQLVPLRASGIIRKRRHLVSLGERTAEIDEYCGVHEGLVVVEVEFPDERAAGWFVPPEWFGPEVTYDPTYKNKNLAGEVLR